MALKLFPANGVRLQRWPGDLLQDRALYDKLLFLSENEAPRANTAGSYWFASEVTMGAGDREPDLSGAFLVAHTVSRTPSPLSDVQHTILDVRMSVLQSAPPVALRRAAVGVVHEGLTAAGAGDVDFVYGINIPEELVHPLGRIGMSELPHWGHDDTTMMQGDGFRVFGQAASYLKLATPR
jgi:hypothetical protein